MLRTRSLTSAISPSRSLSPRTSIAVSTGRVFLVFLVLLALPAVLSAQADDVEIRAEHVTAGVWVLFGQGGNIGVSTGDDGIFLVDDQYAPLTEKIRGAVTKLSKEPIRFVFNTHWHGDHTGGNENLGKSGTLIVAHENVRQRMSVEQFISALDRKVSASPEVALPVVTFNDAVTFHLNGDDIHAFHVPPAHTDGDSVVHFRRADVIHMGDLYFAGTFPFVDLSSGGSVDGLIDAVGKVLEVAGPSTRIIPGHGPVTGRQELAEYHAMLDGLRTAVAGLIAEGKSRDETLGAKPADPWNEAWGGGFINADQIVGTVYDSLTTIP